VLKEYEEELKELEKKIQDTLIQKINSNDVEELNDYNTNLKRLYLQKKFIRYRDFNNDKIKNMSVAQIQEDFIKYQLASVRRVSMKQRIKRKLFNMIYPVFITITFTDDSLTKQFRNNLRILFKKCGIYNYLLISDFGSKTERLHYHGFIDIAKQEKGLFEQTNLKNLSQWNYIPLNRIGYNVIMKLKSSDINKTLNYITKYALKDYDVKHTTFSSRTGSFRRNLVQFNYTRDNYLKSIKKFDYFNF